MTRKDLIHELKLVLNHLQTKVRTSELTDYAKDNAYLEIKAAIEVLEENYSPEEEFK